MTAGKDFFGDVFDDPGDDPLLGDSAGDSSKQESSGSRSEEDGLLSTSSTGGDVDDQESSEGPSWVSGGAFGDAEATDQKQDTIESPDDAGGTVLGPDERSRQGKREIRIGPRGSEGIDKVNRALDSGWVLVDISVVRSPGEASQREESSSSVRVTLERDHPQSLFDFGEKRS